MPLFLSHVYMTPHNYNAHACRYTLKTIAMLLFLPNPMLKRQNTVAPSAYGFFVVYLSFWWCYTVGFGIAMNRKFNQNIKLNYFCTSVQASIFSLFQLYMNESCTIKLTTGSFFGSSFDNNLFFFITSCNKYTHIAIASVRKMIA